MAITVLTISVDCGPAGESVVREWFPVGGLASNPPGPAVGEKNAVLCHHGGGGSLQKWLKQANILNLAQQGRLPGLKIVLLNGMVMNPVSQYAIGEPSVIVDEAHRLTTVGKADGHGWNDGSGTFYKNDVFVGYDDLKFQQTIVGVLSNLGYTRFFVQGGSAGGNISQRALIERRSFYHGGLICSSAMSGSFKPATEPGATPIWYEHGACDWADDFEPVGDPLIPWLGGARNGEWSIPLVQRLNFWKRQNGIAPETQPDSVVSIPDTATGDGCRGYKLIYSSGAAPMVFSIIENMGHQLRNEQNLPDNNVDDVRPGRACHDGDSFEEWWAWIRANNLHDAT